MKPSLLCFVMVAVFLLGGMEGAEAKVKQRNTYANAKKVCLSTSPSLDGNALQSCIKKRREKLRHAAR